MYCPVFIFCTNQTFKRLTPIQGFYIAAIIFSNPAGRLEAAQFLVTRLAAYEGLFDLRSHVFDVILLASPREALDLANCPMSREEWIEKLIEQGWI